MKAIDGAKALGLAVLVLAANLLLTVVVVFAWSQAFARGRSPEFYNALALKIAMWSAPIGGALFMFAVGLVCGRRVPGRNPFVFAGLVFGLYAAVDAASGLAFSPPSEVFRPFFLVSLLFTALGGQVGAALARRRAAAA